MGPMAVDTVPLSAAAHRTRTGDLWLFRGRSAADRVIQTVTNAPVNHVAVAVVLDDLPPLLWHAEMGRSLVDVWTGTRHRGVQLHVLEDAVDHWCRTYGQRAWMRQLHPEVGTEAEDALLETIARWNGVSFPSMGTLAGRWVRGRWESRGRLGERLRRVVHPARGSADAARDGAIREPVRRRAEAAFCAEVAGVSLEQMGVLRGGAAPNWYDPGRFWSGDDLPMTERYRYGREIAVIVPRAGDGRGEPGHGRPVTPAG